MWTNSQWGHVQHGRTLEDTSGPEEAAEPPVGGCGGLGANTGWQLEERGRSANEASHIWHTWLCCTFDQQSLCPWLWSQCTAGELSLRLDLLPVSAATVFDTHISVSWNPRCRVVRGAELHVTVPPTTDPQSRNDPRSTGPLTDMFLW